MMKKWNPKLLWLLLLIPLLAAVGFLIWAATPLGPMDEALAFMNSDSLVTVEQDEWLVFRPAHFDPTVGLVFYPGARVDPRSYAPVANAIASQGYLVVITPMPLNLAVLAPDQAAEVIAAYPQIKRWVVGGHSLGGAIAAEFASQNPDFVLGLALWAAAPGAQTDLSKQSLAVTSIYANQDGLMTGEMIEVARPLLPPSTNWVLVDGGNHAQFGWYGEQSGDNPATISREEQQDQVILATIRLLQMVSIIEEK